MRGDGRRSQTRIIVLKLHQLGEDHGVFDPDVECCDEFLRKVDPSIHSLFVHGATKVDTSAENRKRG